MDENKDAQTEFPSINDYIDSLPYDLENMEIKSDSPFLSPYKQSYNTFNAVFLCRILLRFATALESVIEQVLLLQQQHLQTLGSLLGVSTNPHYLRPGYRILGHRIPGYLNYSGITCLSSYQKSTISRIFQNASKLMILI